MIANALVLAVALATAPSEGHSLPVGAWMTADRSAVLQFDNCANRLCATLVWAREGLGGRDERNHDARLRHRPLCNLAIVGGLSPDGGGKWTGGWFYDPESGVTYKLRLTKEPSALKLFVMDEEDRVLETETLRPAPEHERCASAK